jgi:hypothetical protein
MKKVDNSNISPTALQPFTKITFDYLQQAYTTALLALAKCISGVLDSTGLDVVLWGLVNTGGGSSWAISEGYVYDTADTREEIFYVSQFIHVLVPGQVPVLVEDFSFDNGDPLTFSDGNTHNVHWNRKLKWQMGTSGSGACDYADLIFLNTLRIPAAEEGWHYVDYVGNPSPTGEPTMDNGWLNIGGADTPLRFKKDLQGWIHIEGCIQSGGLGGLTPIFTLPTGYIPTYKKHFNINASTAGAVVLDEIIIDKVSGNVYQVGNGTDNFYTKMDGIIFKCD